MIKEYTFLTTKSFRTKHVHANNIYQAYLQTIENASEWSIEHLKTMGQIIPRIYQVCSLDAHIMSGWKQSQDKRLKTIILK